MKTTEPPRNQSTVKLGWILSRDENKHVKDFRSCSNGLRTWSKTRTRKVKDGPMNVAGLDIHSQGGRNMVTSSVIVQNGIGWFWFDDVDCRKSVTADDKSYDDVLTPFSVTPFILENFRLGRTYSVGTLCDSERTREKQVYLI